LPIRLAHLSDIHFGGEHAGACEAAIEMVASFAPHLVVVTGDLTLNGLPREFRAAQQWLARLPLPRLVTPGNHDTPYWNLPLRALRPFARYQRYIGAPEQSDYVAPGLSAYAINSARGAQPRLNWSRGAINLRRIATVAGQLDDDPASLKVFACHHPLIDLQGAPVAGGVHRGAAAARTLVHAGVDLILTGHVHNPFALTLPGDPRGAFAIGAGTLSLRTRGSPQSYSTIEADAETITVTAMGWTGSSFEPYRSWPLPRRAASTQPIAAA
jgi:3',5'-cyclic AMP phosphodiesterase CpdA